MASEVSVWLTSQGNRYQVTVLQKASQSAFRAVPVSSMVRQQALQPSYVYVGGLEYGPQFSCPYFQPGVLAGRTGTAEATLTPMARPAKMANTHRCVHTRSFARCPNHCVVPISMLLCVLCYDTRTFRMLFSKGSPATEVSLLKKVYPPLGKSSGHARFSLAVPGAQSVQSDRRYLPPTGTAPVSAFGNSVRGQDCEPLCWRPCS